MDKLEYSVPEKNLLSTFTASTEKLTDRRRFVTNISLLMIGLNLITLPVIFIYLVITNDLSNLITLSLSTVAMITYFISWRTARANRVNLAAWIVQSMLTLNISLLFIFIMPGLNVWFVFFLVEIVALIILGPKTAYLITAWSSGLALYNSFTERFTVSGTITPISTPISPYIAVFMVMIMVVVVWLAAYLANHLKQSNAHLNQQAARLEAALLDIQQKRVVGEEVSRQVFSLTAELNATANQQASGSQQQASALSEMTAFIKEMTQTAQAISAKTDQLSWAAELSTEAIGRVKSRARGMTEASENGAVAVAQTISSAQQVNEQYNGLQGLLADLSERQGEIRKVVSTIKGISNETHLLALNAAIEAAGAGEYGERFRIVAEEVKALASRAMRASREVNEILSKVEEGIEKAVRASETGQQEIIAALAIAKESGDLLHELGVNIYENVEEVQLIEESNQAMNGQSREINFATKQQYSASNQALETLQNIGSVAMQSANGSTEVTRSTHHLEELSQTLLTALVA